MEWFYLVLVLALVLWCIQMILSYKRKSEQIDAQIEITTANDQALIQQAETYEEQGAEKGSTLAALQEEDQKLSAQRKELESKLRDVKDKEANRRPTRHRVEPSES